MLLKLFAISLFALPTIAIASKYSTKWTIHNNTKTPITITCKNTSEHGMGISMTSKPIGANKLHVYDWGDSYYNDGLWLNGGKWSCSPLNTASTTKEFDSFTTDWGESIVLIVHNVRGELKLTKSLKNDSSIAKKESLNNKERKMD